MQRVHFIGIGSSSMHNLAIAVSKKNNFFVTGSDENIQEPAISRLKSQSILPEKAGWFPDKIQKILTAVVVGTDVAEDNPELLQAKELKLKIFSPPEYLFLQTRSKTRIVVGGSHGKTTTTAMILHVLKLLKMDADYMIGTRFEGFEDRVRLSYESRIAVFEGDEYLTSPIDRRPKFHLYKPHIAVLTGVAWDHISVFPTFGNYIEQFRKFIDLMEFQGRLIYFNGDDILKSITENVRRDMVLFEYNTPVHEVRNGITLLPTKYGEIPLKIFGEYNLQNLEAARLACRQVGVTDEQFYSAISSFKGVPNRMEKKREIDNMVVFRDSAFSPAKLKAGLKALKAQYPDRRLVVLTGLYASENLTEEYLPQYGGCMTLADKAFVYYNPENISPNDPHNITSEQIKTAFGSENLTVFNQYDKMKEAILNTDRNNTIFLLIFPESFSEETLNQLSNELINQSHD